MEAYDPDAGDQEDHQQGADDDLGWLHDGLTVARVPGSPCGIDTVSPWETKIGG
jgi:hypothetical protein